MLNALRITRLDLAMTTRIARPDYEERLLPYLDTEDIKVLIGVRRSGKSTLLQALASAAATRDGKDNAILIRLDGFDMPLEPTAEWLKERIQAALDKADGSRMAHVFLDEVQEVPAWEKVVRQLRTRERTDVWITGSNAFVLSSDLSTLIGGRYIELKVSPLSFKEYLSFSKARHTQEQPVEALFARYLKYGGMPGQFDAPTESDEYVESMLTAIYETIILNDVATHGGISDIDLLEKLVRYVFVTSGNLFSTRSIANYLTSAGRKTSANTVDNYLRALEGAFIVSRCEQAGISGKQVLRPQYKLYPVDTGLRSLMSGFSPQDLGFQLECVVYNELVRRGYTTSVGTLRSGEVDFVASKRTGEKTYLQVTESLADEATYQRELAPLDMIGDSFPKVVLTLDRYRCGVAPSGVRIVNLLDWLLG